MIIVPPLPLWWFDTLRCLVLSLGEGNEPAAKWSSGAFVKAGIMYRKSPINRSEIYLSVLPLFASGRVRLIDNPKLVTQFVGLERRTFPTGRDRVDHGTGGHDDLCNAAAGALDLASRTSRQEIKMVGASWWSKNTGWVEPSGAAKIDTSVPGGPSYRTQPTMQEMRAPEHTTDGRWRRYTTTAPYDRWSNRG
jgi:hypothetical protein